MCISLYGISRCKQFVTLLCQLFVWAGTCLQTFSHHVTIMISNIVARVCLMSVCVCVWSISLRYTAAFPASHSLPLHLISYFVSLLSMYCQDQQEQRSLACLLFTRLKLQQNFCPKRTHGEIVDEHVANTVFLCGGVFDCCLDFLFAGFCCFDCCLQWEKCLQ